MLSAFLARLRALFTGNAIDRDIEDEMQAHLERETARGVANGMTAADAAAAARRAFGNVTAHQEEARSAYRWAWLEALEGDLRFAFRYFARHKATVAIIIVVLALGTGANTMIFSMFQAQFVRPAPAVPGDAALARLWVQERSTTLGRWAPRGFTHTELSALAAHAELFTEVAAYMDEDVVLNGNDSTESRGVGAQFVTSNFFRALRVPMAAGTGFVQQSDEAVRIPTAVMAHALAVVMYGEAPKAIGRRIMVNDVPLGIVGVAPARFQGALRNMDEPGLWISIGMRAEISRVAPRWLEDSRALMGFGRLAPGVSHEQASAVARLVVANSLPDSAARVGLARTADVLGMNAMPPGDTRQEMLLAFLAIAVIGALILLVGWMSVSSLMVAAAVGRRHEIAVRLSLGASRVRLLRQLITESTILALAGGVAGVVMAWWTLTWMMKSEIDGVDLSPDAGTFIFSLGLALVAGVLFGLTPALHATRGAVAGVMRDSGTGATSRSRLQRTFVTAQIALSQPLLVLLGTMLAMMLSDTKPVAPELSRHVVAVGLRPLKLTGGPNQGERAVDSLLPRIAEHPAVVAATPDPQVIDAGWIVAPARQDGPTTSDGTRSVVNMEGAAPGWFALTDVPIIQGRDVSLADTAGAPSIPVVIGSDLATALWGGANAIGRTIEPPVLRSMANDSVSMTVVGVYDATRPLLRRPLGGGVGGKAMFRVYTARGQQWRRDRILVRTRGPAEPFIGDLRQLIRYRAPSIPISSAMTFARIAAGEYSENVLTASLAGAGGVLALLLASLGLYGVVALAVQQRTREIGVRIAIGANPVRVARMFLGSGVRIGAVALLIGLPLSLVGLRLMLAQGFVIGPDVNVWMIGFFIAAILLAVASAATWIPARRAARVDPATTLRVE